MQTKSANSAPITKTGEYFTTTRRGVEYCAHYMESAGAWFVSSRRLSLGRNNCGSGKYYDSIDQCPAFAALPTLQKLGAI